MQPADTSALASLIAQDIRAHGPMGVGRYMQLCLTHPTLGYYTSGDPLGAQGDFTTAPEISQLFGEMVGIWLINTWNALGKPSPCALAELGPGRGTLMADILRTAQIDPAFGQAIAVHLVEASPALRAKQCQTLGTFGHAPHHHDALETLPNIPTLFIANEFFDALPINQWVRTQNGWNARKVGLDDEGTFTFGVDPTPLPAPKPCDQTVPEGTVLEHSPTQDAAFSALFGHIKQHGGAGLIIDYGTLESGFGDTLQAVKAHTKVSPLDTPGQADLTTHIDFHHAMRLANQADLPTQAITTQGEFLLAMGLLQRAGQLGANAGKETQNAISLSVERLAGDTAMGTLFKVFACAASSIELAGFSATSKTAG